MASKCCIFELLHNLFYVYFKYWYPGQDFNERKTKFESAGFGSEDLETWAGLLTHLRSPPLIPHPFPRSPHSLMAFVCGLETPDRQTAAPERWHGLSEPRQRPVLKPRRKGSRPQTQPELWHILRTLDSKHSFIPPKARKSSGGGPLTLLGGLEAVVEVNPLDVVGQGCVGQQCPVSVDDVGRKSKGVLLGVHDLGVGAVRILKDSSCERWVQLCVLGKEEGCQERRLVQTVLWARFFPQMFNNMPDYSHT